MLGRIESAEPASAAREQVSSARKPGAHALTHAACAPEHALSSHLPPANVPVRARLELSISGEMLTRTDARGYGPRRFNRVGRLAAVVRRAPRSRRRENGSRVSAAFPPLSRSNPSRLTYTQSPYPFLFPVLDERRSSLLSHDVGPLRAPASTRDRKSAAAVAERTPEPSFFSIPR